MTEAVCLVAFWKGFLLGGILGFLITFGLLVLGSCLGEWRMADRQIRPNVRKS